MVIKQYAFYKDGCFLVHKSTKRSCFMAGSSYYLQ